MIATSRHHEAIRTVQLALLQGKQISGLYESPYESKSVRLKLHPYRLCLIKNAWYVIGMVADEDTPRTYRIARFKTLRGLEEAADVPENFDLKEYLGNAWAVYRGDQSYDVELSFTSHSGKIVTETIWHHTQKVIQQKDGSVILTFKIDGLEEITNWILTWTGRCKVVQPTALRDLVVEKLKLALKMNQE